MKKLFLILVIIYLLAPTFVKKVYDLGIKHIPDISFIVLVKPTDKENINSLKKVAHIPTTQTKVKKGYIPTATDIEVKNIYK